MTNPRNGFADRVRTDDPKNSRRSPSEKTTKIKALHLNCDRGRLIVTTEAEASPTIDPEEDLDVPVDVYLGCSYDPDREFVDGNVLERHVGELPHSRLQKYLIRYFASFEIELDVEVLPEQRVQVAPTRYRVPDVCLVPWKGSDKLIVRTPPLVCIEILSREDKIIELRERLEDYRRMGVPHNWVIDPWRQEAFVVQANGDWTLAVEELVIPETTVRVPVAEMFRALIAPESRTRQ